MFRGGSKDRGRKVTPPGPSYMSNDQFGQLPFGDTYLPARRCFYSIRVFYLAADTNMS